MLVTVEIVLKASTFGGDVGGGLFECKGEIVKFLSKLFGCAQFFWVALRAFGAFEQEIVGFLGVQLLKGASSKWIHETFPDLTTFQWQDGYGAFTVSKSHLPEVVDYVAQQREHHKHQTFQDEYRTWLHKPGIEYDERYVWG